jgi:hypothetical protein
MTDDAQVTPTNSERLYMVLDALTGDSEPANWRINAVQGLLRLARMKAAELGEDGEDATSEIFLVEEMLQRLSGAFAGLPESLPRLRSPEEVETLKRQWHADPCFDLEEAEGFEAHAEDLLRYRYESELASCKRELRCIQDAAAVLRKLAS